MIESCYNDDSVTKLNPSFSVRISFQIGDLGLSKVKQHTLVSGGIRGTLPWMAPELLSGKSNMVTEKVKLLSLLEIYLVSVLFLSERVLNCFLPLQVSFMYCQLLFCCALQIDVYSFGIVMWELLTGDEPYADMHCASIIGMHHNRLFTL